MSWHPVDQSKCSHFVVLNLSAFLVDTLPWIYVLRLKKWNNLALDIMVENHSSCLENDNFMQLVIKVKVRYCQDMWNCSQPETKQSWNQRIVQLIFSFPQIPLPTLNRNDQKNCVLLIFTVIFMILTAVAFVATRVALKGLPVNKIKSPPYRNECEERNFSELFGFGII